MAIRLLNVVCLAALVVFPAHSRILPGPDEKIAAITTYLQFITEDDVDQRTKLNLLLAQKQVGREDVIRELSEDSFKIAKAEGAGLLSDALVDKAFADMCSRLNVAPVDLMKTLEEKGSRLDTLRKRLKSDVARERLAQMPRRYEDRTRSPSHSQNVNKQRPKFPRCSSYVRPGHFRRVPAEVLCRLMCASARERRSGRWNLKRASGRAIKWSAAQITAP